MSWLARSLVNSLKVDEDDNITEDRNTESIKEKEDENQIETPETPGRGVKEDLSELTKSLSRQFWGVASFLVPPPPPPSDPSISDWNRWESSEQSQSGETSDPEIDDSAKIAGIRSDFAEIGGKFKTGISKLSNNKAVSEISKIASTFLPFGSDEGFAESYLLDGVVGVTDEVLTFARNIAMHPETWLDFPLVDDEDSDEFDMSDAQQEHALAVEHLAPRLAALRIELCPGHMTEGCFWKIYFVLLHSRLNKHDAELLSTPQIVEARAMLMQELLNQTKPEPDSSGSGTLLPKEAANSLQEECPTSSGNAFSETVSLKTFTFESTTPVVATDFETEKHPIVSTEMRIIDKSVIEEGPAIQAKNEELLPGFSSIVSDQKYEEDGDDWLDEHSEIGGFSGTTIPLGNEEDVSFSDLEDDNDGGVPSSSKTVVYDSNSSTKETQGWVELNRNSANSAKDGQSMRTKHLGSGQLLDNNPETKEPNDWLSVDKVDMM